LYAETTGARTGERAHRDSVTKIPFKATGGRPRSIIVDNRIA
jgi:hypothetical protein